MNSKNPLIPNFVARIARQAKADAQRGGGQPAPRTTSADAPVSMNDPGDSVESELIVGETPIYLWSRGLRPSTRLPASPVDPDTLRTMMYQAGAADPQGLLSASGTKAAGASLVLTITPPAAVEVTVPGVVIEVGTNQNVTQGNFTATITGTSKTGAAYTSGALGFKVLAANRQRLIVFGAATLTSGNLYPKMLRARSATYPILPTGLALPGITGTPTTGVATAAVETLVVTISSAPDGMYFDAALLTPDHEAWSPAIVGLIAAQKSRFG